MRTTLSLDDDVAAALDRLRAERGLGLSEAVNTLVRAGLAADSGSGEGFVQRTAPVGFRIDISNVSEVLELLDETSG